MKTFLTFNFILLTFNLFAQWQPDVRLTNNPFTSYTSYNTWCIAASGNVVHVVWWDARNGNDEIYYKRSADGGVSWGADTRLTNNSAGSYSPSVAISGTFVHVVWFDLRDGNYELYYKRSTDAGISWEPDRQLTNDPAFSVIPSVSASGTVVHVVWRDTRDGANGEIYYKRATASGLFWGADTRLTYNSAVSTAPSGTVSGSNVHVAWADNRDGNYEIYYKRSTDGGVSWGADTRLTNNPLVSSGSSISVSGSMVHVVWHDQRNGVNGEIYYKRSTDAGISWGADTRLTNNIAESNNPSVAVSALFVHVVWWDTRDSGNYEIYYKRSTDGGVIWGSDTRLTNAPSISEDPSVCLSGSVVHLVWTDERDGNFEIYYKRDPTGNPVGIIPISTEIPNQFSLSQNYPNPFNPTTVIRFQVSSYRFVKLNVYDILGREVATLVNEKLQPGTYEVVWDAGNFASGVYYYTLTTEYFNQTKRMVLIK